MHISAAICISLMVISLALLFIGLPGNWVILGLAVLWSIFGAAVPFSWKFLTFLGGLAFAGEIAEFLAGHFGSKRFGGTNKGSIGGMVGAIAGGIFCAPIFFGFGALLGALGGGFLGSFIVERARGMQTNAALKAAYGCTLGRFGGFVVKLSVGIIMLRLAAPHIWESV